MTTLKEWNVSVLASIAATFRSFHIAATSVARSSDLRRTLSDGRPNASAATFAALDAAAAAAAVTRLASNSWAKARREAAETVLVFML